MVEIIISIIILILVIKEIYIKIKIKMIFTKNKHKDIEMGKMVPRAFLKVFNQLWSLPVNMEFGDVINTPVFKALCDYIHVNCYSEVKSINDKICLAQGLFALGVPCFFNQDSPLVNSHAKRVAKKCYQSLMQRRTRVRYLCPLDCAGVLPSVTFGNATIKIYDPTELDALVNSKRIRRHPDYKAPDTVKLSYFQWLVVEIKIDLPPRFQQRYMTNPTMDFRKYGTLYPYKNHYPKDVESALFLLMLAPWEKWLDEHDLNWRPFDIPWVHTIHDDIFEWQRPILDASTLTWYPDFRYDSNGEVIELEEPYERNNLATEDKLNNFLSKEFRNNLTKAIKNGLINAPAQHQFIKAFISLDIDAFLANIIVIDACMGSTHAEHKKITDKRYKKLGPTGCLKYRLVGLLEDKSVIDTMGTLYDYRSRYVHGDDIAEIESNVPLQARTLTRKMLVKIIFLTDQNPTLTREAFLYDTLEKGWMLMHPTGQ